MCVDFMGDFFLFFVSSFVTCFGDARVCFCLGLTEGEGATVVVGALTGVVDDEVQFVAGAVADASANHVLREVSPLTPLVLSTVAISWSFFLRPSGIFSYCEAT